MYVRTGTGKVAVSQCYVPYIDFMVLVNFLIMDKLENHMFTGKVLASSPQQGFLRHNKWVWFVSTTSVGG